MKTLLALCLTLYFSSFSMANEALRTPDNVDEVNPPVSTAGNKALLLSGEVSLWSDDIFRGVSMSQHEPVVQGWLGLSYMQFLNAGFFTTSTNFPVAQDPTLVAKRYNVYYASVYVPVKEVIFGLQYFRYDFMEHSSMNQDEYFLEIMYKNLKLSAMNNPNYLQVGSKYQYYSAEYKFELTEQDSITPLVSTTVIEKPEVVDIRNYQELRVTYTRDLKLLKVNTVFSTTNREKFYTDEKYKDTAVAFGVTVPF